MGFHPAKFGLPRPFCSPVMSRHATDGWRDERTDRQTDNRGQFIMPPLLWGRSHSKRRYRETKTVITPPTQLRVTVISSVWMSVCLSAAYFNKLLTDIGCTSVRPSVCPSHAGIVSTRNGSTHRQTVFTAWYSRDSSFLRTKLFLGIPMGTPLTGALNARG